MKTMLKRIFRSQAGFTLIELLAVLAIISVLAGIVTAAVSGTKGASVESQVKSDGTAAGTATDNYNTGSLTSSFPEQPLDSSSKVGAAFTVGGGIGVGVTLLDSTGKPIGAGTTLASVASHKSGQLVAARTAIDFSASTEAYQKDGSIGSSTLVPDFLAKEPSSLALEGAATRGLDDNPIPEFLWLYAVVSPGSERENRRTEVYRLDTAVCVTSLPTTASIKVSTSSFTGSDGSVSTATATSESSNAFTGLRTAVTDSKTHATTGLTKRISELAAAEKGVENATAALSAAKVALDKAQKVGAGNIAAQTAVSRAEATLANAKSVLIGGNLVATDSGTPDSITGVIATFTAASPATVPDGGAQGAVRLATAKVNDAISNLVAAQVVETGNAVTGNAGCSGSNKVMNLNYKRLF